MKKNDENPYHNKELSMRYKAPLENQTSALCELCGSPCLCERKCDIDAFPTDSRYCRGSLCYHLRNIHQCGHITRAPEAQNIHHKNVELIHDVRGQKVAVYFYR